MVAKKLFKRLSLPHNVCIEIRRSSDVMIQRILAKNDTCVLMRIRFVGVLFMFRFDYFSEVYAFEMQHFNDVI